jgi:hypothetical protein
MKLNIPFCLERRHRLARPSQTFFSDLQQVRQVSRGQQNALRCRARLRKLNTNSLPNLEGLNGAL